MPEVIVHGAAAARAAGRRPGGLRGRRSWPAIGCALVLIGLSGGSSCRCRSPEPSPKAGRASRASAEPAAEPTPAPQTELPAIESPPAKLAAYRAYLDDADLTFHALRISWPGARGEIWRWPSWLSPDDAAGAVEIVARLGDTPPRIPAVDEAARRYVEVVRPELARWRELVEQASDASRWDEVVASFDRFVTASRALRDAVAAVPEPDPPPGSYAAMVKACRGGSELAAAATWFAQPPAEAGSTATSMPAATVELDALEFHRAGLACHRAALAYLEARAPDDHETTYDLALHVELAMTLLQEAERRARPRRYLSALPTHAHSAAYAARRRSRLAGR